MKGGLRFDLAALLYTNALYLAMQIIPFKFRYNSIYQKVAKWVFLVFNAVALIGNFIDIVYFRFTNRRTTASVFTEFENESNISKVFLESLIANWYVVLVALAIIWLLWCLYYIPKRSTTSIKSPYIYYPLQVLLFADR